MRFPNGHKGVKKLFASEILNIAATLLFFATAVISIINSKKSSDDRYLTAVFVLLLFAGIVAIVSFLLQIIGINQARKDGRYFGTALIFLFAGIPADIVASVTQGTFRNIFSSINEVLTLLVTVYIILGIYDLAEKLENKNLMLHGKVVLFLRVRFCRCRFVPHRSRFCSQNGVPFQPHRRGDGVYRLPGLFDLSRQSKENAFRKRIGNL